MHHSCGKGPDRIPFQKHNTGIVQSDNFYYSYSQEIGWGNPLDTRLRNSSVRMKQERKNMWKYCTYTVSDKSALFSSTSSYFYNIYDHVHMAKIYLLCPCCSFSFHNKVYLKFFGGGFSFSASSAACCSHESWLYSLQNLESQTSGILPSMSYNPICFCPTVQQSFQYSQGMW